MVPQRIAILLLSGLLVGCAASRVGPRRSVVQQFDAIDTLMVGDVQIHEPATINHLKAIYANAKWRPFIDTMPVDTITIRGMAEGQERIKLLYGGPWLMEADEDGPVRKAALSSDEHQWMLQNIRPKLPLNPNIH